VWASGANLSCYRAASNGTPGYVASFGPTERLRFYYSRKLSLSRLRQSPFQDRP
jgi:hypothetical protein